MATSATKLNNYLDFLDRTLDLDRGAIEEAPNGDRYIEVSVTTDNTWEEQLERRLVNSLNRAVDPDAYGINTGPTGGKNTSTYTFVYDKSSKDFDLISGDYTTYRNDLAGISDSDVPFARQGFATGIFLDGHAYRIALPTAEVFGKLIKDWTENWWTWALQAPAAMNPLNDPTGQWADIDNEGPVFFAAGALSGTFERTLTVPEDTPILIPVYNFVSVAFNSDPPDYTDQAVAAWEAGVTGLSATIDGDPVENIEAYLVRTDYFTPGDPEPGSLLASFGIPSGDDLFPSMGTGYYLMIEGLAPGPHTITVTGTSEVSPPVTITDHIFIL